MLLRRLDETAPRAFEALVGRRLGHEPVAYIIGVQEFFGREFAVEPGVLIPRSDSETIVEAALDACTACSPRILDLGVGSGALLLTVLSEMPHSVGLGIDRSVKALAVARRNAVLLGLGARCEMLERSWLDDGWASDLGKFDLVLCNPPYVEDGATLAPDIREHEPQDALFAGPEGLDDYRALVPQLPALLASRGIAILEIGASQTEAVTKVAQAAGFAVDVRRDLARRPRALILW
jgi:release factor glutamine methyltransferase